MASYLAAEAAEADRAAEKLRSALEHLLIPKDPNAGKNVVVEIRAGAGGQEAALWAGELFEMYRRYAERHRWKTDVLATSPRTSGDSRRPSSRSRARTPSHA